MISAEAGSRKQPTNSRNRLITNSTTQRLRMQAGMISDTVDSAIPLMVSSHA